MKDAKQEGKLGRHERQRRQTERCKRIQAVHFQNIRQPGNEQAESHHNPLTGKKARRAHQAAQQQNARRQKRQVGKAEMDWAKNAVKAFNDRDLAGGVQIELHPQKTGVAVEKDQTHQDQRFRRQQQPAPPAYFTL